MNILLIAGHGDGDSGAIGNGYKEADLTREFVALLHEKLKHKCNTDIADTDINWFQYLGTKSFDFSKYDYVLEVYFNAGGGTGSEIYVTSSEAGISVEQEIVAQLCNAGNLKNRGVKRKNFRVINRVKAQGVSSALIEVCFIDNANDISVYQSKKNVLAQAVATGILEGFGLDDAPSEATGNHSIEIPQWAETAVSWCKDNNLLPDITVDLDENKLWMCTLLYNTIKFMAEND